jgi:hypothetical protein
MHADSQKVARGPLQGIVKEDRRASAYSDNRIRCLPCVVDRAGSIELVLRSPLKGDRLVGLGVCVQVRKVPPESKPKRIYRRRCRRKPALDVRILCDSFFVELPPARLAQPLKNSQRFFGGTDGGGGNAVKEHRT